MARLPGHGSQILSSVSIAAFATAFDEVADQLGPTVVLGLSIGALVALSMRSPNVRRVVAAEPPLETAKLFQIGTTMVSTYSEHADFYRNIMGFDGQSFPGRNYLHLPGSIDRPVDFIVGDQPLFPTRPAHGQLFSMVDEAQRHLIRNCPQATLHVATNAGHAVQRQAGSQLLKVIFHACDAVESHSA